MDDLVELLYLLWGLVVGIVGLGICLALIRVALWGFGLY